MSISIRTLVKDKYVYQSLGLKPAQGVEILPGGDNKSIIFKNPKITQLSGKDEEVSSKLGQGRIYELDFGTINSAKDIVLVSVNPALGRTAVVTNPTVIGAKREYQLSFPVYTIKATDLAELDWIIRLHVLA